MITYLLILTSSIFSWYAIYQMVELKTGRRLGFLIYGILITIIPLWRQWLVVNHVIVFGDVNAAKVLSTVYMIVVFLLGAACMEGGLINAILVVALVELCMSLDEIIAISIFYVLFGYHAGNQYSISIKQDHFLVQWILYAVLFSMTFVLPQNIFRKFRKIKMERFWFTRMAAVIYLAFGFSPWMTLLHEAGQDTNKMKYILTFCSIIFLAGFILLLYAEERRYRRQNFYLFLQEQMMREHYKLQEENMNLARRMRHDIRKHLDAISCYCFSGKSEQKWKDIESYSQELREMYKNLSYGDYCSVADINVVLYQLDKYCRKHGIALRIQLKNLNVEKTDTMEIVKVFTLANYWVSFMYDYLQKNRSQGRITELHIQGDYSAGRNTVIYRCVTSCNITKKMEKKISENEYTLAMRKIIGQFQGYECGKRLEKGYTFSWSIPRFKRAER